MMTDNRFKPLISLLLIFIAAPLLAALVTPWVYQAIQSQSPQVMEWVHHCETVGTHALLSDLADSIFTASFRRVNARIVLVFALIFIYPAYRMGGFRSFENLGIPSRGNWRQLFLSGLVIALLSMLLVYILGMCLGVFVWDVASASALFAGVIKIFFGGLLIGILEEIFFRGFVFNAMRKALGLIPGIVLSSIFFAVIHFVKPDSPEITSRWYSGFLLFLKPFAGVEGAVLQQVCTLFSMGVVLAALSYWTRSVYLAIGLHIGWVWTMMFFRLFADNQENMVWLYGVSDWLPNSWMGPIMAVVVLILFFLTRKKWIALGSEG